MSGYSGYSIMYKCSQLEVNLNDDNDLEINLSREAVSLLKEGNRPWVSDDHVTIIFIDACHDICDIVFETNKDGAIKRGIALIPKNKSTLVHKFNDSPKLSKHRSLLVNAIVEYIDEHLYLD